MILTDREWLRFVTFALFTGGVLGALYTGALVVYGRPAVWAMAGAVTGVGLLALGVHLVVRYLLDQATAPPAEEIEDDPTSDQPETKTDTDT